MVKECKGETQLLTLAEKLTQEGIAHKLWTEQPENINVGLATRPATKEETQSVWKGNGVGIWR